MGAGAFLVVAVGRREKKALASSAGGDPQLLLLLAGLVGLQGPVAVAESDHRRGVRSTFAPSAVIGVDRVAVDGVAVEAPSMRSRLQIPFPTPGAVAPAEARVRNTSGSE